MIIPCCAAAFFGDGDGVTKSFTMSRPKFLSLQFVPCGFVSGV